MPMIDVFNNTDGRTEIDLEREPEFRVKPRANRCEPCFGVGTEYVRYHGAIHVIACPSCQGTGVQNVHSEKGSG